MTLKYNKNFERRAFLRGVGGAVLALPALEAFTLRGAKAAVPSGCSPALSPQCSKLTLE